MSPLPSTAATVRTIALAKARKSIYLASASSTTTSSQTRTITSSGTQPRNSSVSAMSSSIFLSTSLAAKTAGVPKSADKMSYDAPAAQRQASLQSGYLRAVAKKMAEKKETVPTAEEPASSA